MIGQGPYSVTSDVAGVAMWVLIFAAHCGGFLLLGVVAGFLLGLML